MKPTPSLAPAVVALHSSGAGGRQWDSYRSLAAPGVRMVAPDLAGYGPGSAAWPNGAPISLEEEARRLLPVLQEQARPVDLVGHSYGGAVAVRMATLWPDRVRSLVVYEPVLFHLLREDEASADHAATIEGVARRVALLVLSGCALDAAQVFVSYWSGDAAWERMPPARRAGVAATMSKVRAEFGALFSARFSMAPLAISGIPVRIVRGTRSPLAARRVVDLLATRLPRAELVTVPGAGHMGPVTDRQLVSPHLMSAPAHRELALAA